MLFFVLFLLSIVASTAGYVVDLDDTVETRLGDFVRGLREERLNNNEVDSEDLKFHDGDDDDNENSIGAPGHWLLTSWRREQMQHNPS